MDDFRNDRCVIRKPDWMISTIYDLICGRLGAEVLAQLTSQLSEFPLCFVETREGWPWRIVFTDITDKDFTNIRNFLQDHSHELFHDFYQFPES